MRVLLNSGRRIGEVVEIDYPTAKIMIADGRASDPRMLPAFADGGEIPATATFLVGDSARGSFVSHPVADVVASAMSAMKKKGGRRGE